MNRFHFMFIATSLFAQPTFASNDDTEALVSDVQTSENIIGTDATEPSGFITEALNNAIASSMNNLDDDNVEYGRSITKYASAPKFGGYAIGKYSYTDQDTKMGGDGFNARLIRVYVDGTILNDFKYRIQMELNGDKKAHIKDFTLEWAKYKEFSVKVGQFKRAFTFENPYNPWDVGTGDYSQLVKKLAGMGDYNGEASMGGRDQGLQIAGDLFPISDDKHRLIHYQLAVYNGQGINVKDENGNKDLIGTIQFQPIKDLYIGLFGWDGKYTSSGITVDRHRYNVGVKYEHNSWTVRGEYAHSQGHKISDYNKTTGIWAGNGKADAWYMSVGVPVNDWFKCYVKYDTYRDDATWSTAKSIYSICPNIQLHKNLMFQVQYNYVNDKTAARDKHYNELWAETYFRF